MNEELQRLYDSLSDPGGLFEQANALEFADIFDKADWIVDRVDVPDEHLDEFYEHVIEGLS